MARLLLTGEEPIPDYATRDIGLLESALANPQQQFDGQLLYPTLAKQSAILFYTLIKNHPLKNGNKRIAVMGLLAHLALNSRWMSMSAIGLYDLACLVAESRPGKRTDILKRIERSIDMHLIDLPNMISH